MASLDVQVRRHLQAYLLGAESLPDFHAWFVEWRRANPDLEDSYSQEVDLRLAEYTGGHWSEPELRSRLLERLEGLTVALNEPENPERASQYGYHYTQEASALAGDRA